MPRRSPTASATSRSPGSARVRDPTAGAGRGCSSRATTTRGRRRADPTAGGALHWAPLRPPGPARADGPDRRVGGDARAAADGRRRVGRGHRPGADDGRPDRRDGHAGRATTIVPHQLAYRLADAIIAPWPAWAPVLRRRRAVAGEDRTRSARSRASTGARRLAPGTADARGCVVLSGRGGTELTVDMLAAAERATPEWAWTVLGPPGDPLGRRPVAAAVRGRRHRHPRRAERDRRRRGRQAPGRRHRPAATARRAARHRAGAAARRSSPSCARLGRRRRTGTRVLEAAAAAGRQRLGALEHRDGRRARRDVLGELACAPR